MNLNLNLISAIIWIVVTVYYAADQDAWKFPTWAYTGFIAYLLFVLSFTE